MVQELSSGAVVTDYEHVMKKEVYHEKDIMLFVVSWVRSTVASAYKRGTFSNDLKVRDSEE